MFRVELPQRSADHPHLESDTFKSQAGYWLEGVGYEITQQQAETLRAAMAEMQARFSDVMDYLVAHHDVVRRFYFTGSKKLDYAMQDAVIASWRIAKDRSYVLDRWDIGWDGVNPPKLLE